MTARWSDPYRRVPAPALRLSRDPGTAIRAGPSTRSRRTTACPLDATSVKAALLARQRRRSVHRALVPQLVPSVLVGQAAAAGLPGWRARDLGPRLERQPRRPPAQLVGSAVGPVGRLLPPVRLPPSRLGDLANDRHRPRL